MKLLTPIIALILALNVCAETKAPSSFGFEAVRLDMQISDIPDIYKADCESPKDKRYKFCFYRTESVGIHLSVEFYFNEDRVQSIRVYFPRVEYDSIWLALRKRYGQEESRSIEKAEWFTGSRELSRPMPDELALVRNPEPLPVPDGKYIKEGVEYALIEYTSMVRIREQMKQKQDERERQLKTLSEKL